MSAKNSATRALQHVVSNLLQQNVYVRDVAPIFDERRDYRQETYPELEVVDFPNGYAERVVEKPYPHTPEQVASYADSCDYRLNLDAALAAPPGPNLGDVRIYQSMFDQNGLELREKMLAAQAKYQEYLAQSSRSQPQRDVLGSESEKSKNENEKGE